MFFTPSQQWAGSTEKVGYSESGQTLAMNGKSVKLIYSHKGRYSQGMCFKESCCINILGKDKGTQVSSSAGKEQPTSQYSSTDKDSVVNQPAN